MSMPKTAMNEDRSAMFFQDEIRLARNIFGMKAEAKAQSMQAFADQKLRFGVFCP